MADLYGGGGGGRRNHRSFHHHPQHAALSSNAEAGTDDTILRTLWEMYLLQPRHDGLVRHLVLPPHGVTTSGLEYLLRKIRDLVDKDRPGTLTWHPYQQHGGSSPSWRSTKLVVDLVTLCRSSLCSFYIANYFSVASEASNILISRTAPVLENLESLFLDDVEFGENLVEVFASVRCKIQSFSTRFEELDTMICMIHILETYTKLRQLHINCPLESEDAARDFLAAIEKSPSRLTRLHLHGSVHLHNGLPSLAPLLDAQQELKILDLRWSYDLDARDILAHDDDPKWIFASQLDTELFMGALAFHPCLNEVNLMDCPMTNPVFTSLLMAAEQNPKLQRIVVGACELDGAEINDIDSDGEWLRVLPRLQNLHALVAFAPLIQTPEWNTHVLPYLRQNTSITQLVYTGDDFLWPRSSVFDPEFTLVDEETKQVLRRNQLLQSTAPYLQGTPLLLALWPGILRHLASNAVDASALYAFLCKKSYEIPESKAQQQIQRLAEKMSALKDENRALKEQRECELQQLLTRLASVSSVEQIRGVVSDLRHSLKLGKNNSSTTGF